MTVANQDLYASAMLRSCRPTRRRLAIVAVLLSSLSATSINLLTPSYAGRTSSATGAHAKLRHRYVPLIGLDPLLLKERPKTQVALLTNIQHIGIKSVRLVANWRFIQNRGPKTSNWAAVDLEVREARAAHLSIDMVITGCPAWEAIANAKSRMWPQPKSALKFGSFAAMVAKRYASKGVRDFEIWNEPNDSKFFQPVANVTAYTKMLIASYKAIKKVDKSAFVISGGFAPVISHRGSVNPIAFLKAMYAHGAKGHFDALGDHPYSFPALPNTFSRSSWWSQMALTKPSLRSIMAQHHDSKRIWITEYGAPSNGPGGVSEKAQAAELKQAIIDTRTKSWIGAIYIYTWQDLGTDSHTKADWFGLLTFNGKRKPAYFAVLAAIKQRVS
jgi:hypothetical protein